jgi:hypothetical protein
MNLTLNSIFFAGLRYLFGPMSLGTVFLEKLFSGMKVILGIPTFCTDAITSSRSEMDSMNLDFFKKGNERWIRSRENRKKNNLSRDGHEINNFIYHNVFINK